jgi:hypothetical protein
MRNHCMVPVGLSVVYATDGTRILYYADRRSFRNAEVSCHEE